MRCRLQGPGTRGKHQTKTKKKIPGVPVGAAGCRIQDPGTRGYRWWKTADVSYSAGIAHGAPPRQRPHTHKQEVPNSSATHPDQAQWRCRPHGVAHRLGACTRRGWGRGEWGQGWEEGGGMVAAASQPLHRFVSGGNVCKAERRETNTLETAPDVARDCQRHSSSTSGQLWGGCLAARLMSRPPALLPCSQDGP
jgi:hypothetical protein